MAEIQFYHLLSTSLERALPKLLEKALAGNYRVVVRVDSEERAELLSNELWTYNPNGFLPHGTHKDGFPDQQPIYVTHKDENPNTANLFVATDGQKLGDPQSYTRILDIFDGTDHSAVAGARSRWSEYKSGGHSLTYIRQNASGGWDKMAEA